MASVLVVDDERSMRDFLKILLEKEGHKVAIAESGKTALDILDNQQVDVIVSDIRMPGMTGIDLLEAVKEQSPDLPVIMITAFASPDDAVLAMKNGAFDYITKPFNVDEIKSVIESATSKTQQTIKPKDLSTSFPEIIGKSREMLKIFDMIQRVAPTPANVLIYGESGTGKELVAQAIHYNSPRRHKPFIRINCAALPDSLIESELFGHERGAFTGAVERRKGRFELAAGGTIFLDEIGDVSPAMQVRLLRVLQEREFERVGGAETLSADVRVVAATSRNLEQLMEQRRFREDLFYRLNVFPIIMPPLRDRGSDILLLADHFLEKYAALHAKPVNRITERALELLMRHAWPGNVRELENVVERAVLLTADGAIHSSHLPPSLQQAAGAISPARAGDGHADGFKGRVVKFELEMLRETLQECRGNAAEAARRLNTTSRILRYRLRQAGLDLREFRARPAK